MSSKTEATAVGFNLSAATVPPRIVTGGVPIWRGEGGAWCPVHRRKGEGWGGDSSPQLGLPLQLVSAGVDSCHPPILPLFPFPRAAPDSPSAPFSPVVPRALAPSSRRAFPSPRRCVGVGGPLASCLRPGAGASSSGRKPSVLRPRDRWGLRHQGC